MNKLSTQERAQAVACLVEGNSQRATCRMTGLAKKTVGRLAVELGEACERFADNIMRDLPCTRIQCDEIWSFCYSKQKNVPKHLKGSGADSAKSHRIRNDQIQYMKLLTISLASLAVSFLLCWSAMRTAESIAKATMPRIEMLP